MPEAGAVPKPEMVCFGVALGLVVDLAVAGLGVFGITVFAWEAMVFRAVCATAVFLLFEAAVDLAAEVAFVFSLEKVVLVFFDAGCAACTETLPVLDTCTDTLTLTFVEAETWSAFLLVPFGGAAAAGAFSIFFASRSRFAHSFFRSASILWTCAGTTRPPFITASNRRLCAVPLTLDGGSP